MRTTQPQQHTRIPALAAAAALCLLALCALLALVPACAFAADDALVTSREVAAKGDDALEHTDAILYRIGNDNAVDFGTLFAELDAADLDDESVEVTVTQHTTANGYSTDDCDSSLSATLTYDTSDWTAGTIQFSDHTGVVSIVLADATSTEFTLLAEVVDGKNLFEGDIDADTASASKTYSKTDLVLLGDQAIGGEQEYYIQFSSCTVYGNGFTIDASDGVIANGTYFGIVLLTNANLDNVSVVGPEFGTSNINYTSSSNYSVGTVRTSGECSITDSYVFGGHCALKVESGSSTCTVTDSVFAGGNWANIEVKNGELIVEGTVTTVNEPNSSVSSVGLGIVVGAPENLLSPTITINGTLNQYNWVSTSDSSYFASDVSTIVTKAAGISTVNGYTNTGVLFLVNTADSSGMPSGYAQGSASISVSGVSATGYLWYPTSIPDDGLDYRSTAYEWETEAQGCYEPTYTWSYPEETGYCAYSSSNDVLTLTIASSDSSVTLSDVTDIVSAVKHGQTLTVSASAIGDGTVTTSDSGDSLTFTDTGSYVITFTVQDPLVYAASASRSGTEVKHELTLDVTVSKEATNAPTFTFVDESSGEYTGTVVSIDGSNYVTIADTTSSGDCVVTNSSYKYTDSNGDSQNLMYTQVYGYGAKEDSSTYYRYVPIYKGIKISYTYTDDSGDEVTDTISPTITTSNSNYAMAGDYSTTGLTGGNGWNTSTAYTTFKSYYCRKTAGLNASTNSQNSNITSDKTYDVLYSYTAPDTSTVYYFYIRYYFYAYDDTDTKDSNGETYNNSSCIPTGTQITLADGSTTAVENLTGDEELLVFDHETGAYTTSSIVFVQDYGEDDNEVMTLSFSDGSTTELIYEHGYFDLTQNKYVYIRKDTYDSYLGDEFVVGDGESISTVTLEDVTVETRYTGCYSLVTAKQLNYFVDAFLSMPSGIEGLFNIFEYGDNLIYDADLMAADIEQYGLFTYADFEDYIPEDIYEAFNGKYLKVSIGKGYTTFEEILALIEKYSEYF